MSRRSRTPTGPESFEAIDRTIHEPARLSLLAHLVVLDEADFVYLQNETGMTRGNLGGHMTKLESVGYVTVEKTYRQRTPRTVFALTDKGRSALLQWREQMAGIVAMLPSS
ncbi:MAG: transcriptional regulator [Actinobacteria bacterium]|nr:MAG: transcriptional regulator [Actinomycetota bacterium]